MMIGRNEFLAGLAGQWLGQQYPQVEDKDKPKRLPDGTLQSEAILKEEQKRLLADAGKLIQMAQDVEEELKKNEHHVLSVGMIKKLEEIEKLARRIRSRHTR
jgi:deoxyxylulose-5-phosphate synthase